MKLRKVLTALLCLCMLSSLVPSIAMAEEDVLFNDVNKNDWFYDSVNYVTEKGLMNGMEENAFYPSGDTTRGMMVTVLYRMEGSPEVKTENKFVDVPADAYYKKAVDWATENAIVDGFGDGTFAPTNPITREQLATIFYRYAGLKGEDIAVRAELSEFSDADTIREYAKEPIAWAVGIGLMNGMNDGIFSPQTNAMRAQIATMLYRYCEMDNIKENEGEKEEEIAEEYTVVFDYNYNDKGTYKELTVKAGELVEKPKAPTRSGYDFDGWYTKSANGTEFDFDTEIVSDITLYANWKKVQSSLGGGGVGFVHKHRFTYTSNHDGTHTRDCTCIEPEIEECTIIDGVCSKCGQSIFVLDGEGGDKYMQNTEFQRAIKDLPDGSTVTLKNGNFRVVFLTEYNVPKNLTVVGDDTVTVKEFAIEENVEGITLKNLKLENVLSVTNANAATVKSLTIDNCTAKAIHMGNAAGSSLVDATIKNCIITGPLTGFNGITLNNVSGTTKVENNTINNSDDIGIALLGNVSGDVNVEGNTVAGTGDRALRVNAVQEGATVAYKNNIVSDCAVAATADEGVFKVSSVGTDASITFEGNTYDGEDWTPENIEGEASNVVYYGIVSVTTTNTEELTAALNGGAPEDRMATKYEVSLSDATYGNIKLNSAGKDDINAGGADTPKILTRKLETLSFEGESREGTKMAGFGFKEGYAVNYKDGGGVDYYVVRSHDIGELKFKNITFTDSVKIGSLVNAYTSEPTVKIEKIVFENVTFDFTDNSTASNGAFHLIAQGGGIGSVSFTNCSFINCREGNTFNGIAIDTRNADDIAITVDNCDFTNIGYNAIQLAGAGSSYTGTIVIKENRITNTGDRTIRISTIGATGNVAITDNVMTNASDDAGELCKASVAEGATVTINGNTWGAREGTTAVLGMITSGETILDVNPKN